MHSSYSDFLGERDILQLAAKLTRIDFVHKTERDLENHNSRTGRISYCMYLSWIKLGNEGVRAHPK